MKKKRLIMTAALLSAFCMSAAGCSLYPGNKETQPANASQAETETKDETKQQPTGETEEETEKPTDAHPEDIEPFPHGEKETKAEPMKNGKRIVLMTDIHYLADSLTDKGEEFQYMVEHGDGKLTNYVWEITDAAFEQVEALSPDVIILSGDLTLNGEKESHKELAKKLEQVEKDGIQVVVIPGNHDINNRNAASFDG
ncbi:MAG: metallophosphoesterase family protein, partial [Clostridium sp.]